MNVIADETQVAGLIDALAQAIRERIGLSTGAEPWALIGVRSRGDVIARRLAEQLDGTIAPERVGAIDITLYRDDLSEIGAEAVVRTTDVPFALDGVNVVLVDDVLATGRSVRAALQSLMDFGRPRRVWLAVLADRGGRELPISPDFVGLRLGDLPNVARHDRIDVHIRPTDPVDQIVIQPAAQSGAPSEA